MFWKLEEALKGNTFIGEIEFKDPTENEREKVTKEIKDWITKYLEK